MEPLQGLCLLYVDYILEKILGKKKTDSQISELLLVLGLAYL